jgi:acylphosphatase
MTNRESAPSDVSTRRILVGGHVQGVGFRVTCARRARAAGLSGWVRNLDDGRVEVVLQGPAGSVQEVERWCAHGPQMAVVTSVDASDEPRVSEHGFAVR